MFRNPLKHIALIYQYKDQPITQAALNRPTCSKALKQQTDPPLQQSDLPKANRPTPEVNRPTLRLTDPPLRLTDPPLRLTDPPPG